MWPWTWNIDGVLCQESITIPRPVSDLIDRVMNLEAILQYYPDPIAENPGVLLEEGKQVIIRGTSSVTLLERIDADPNDPHTVHVQVTVCAPNNTMESAEAATAKPMFVMKERWQFKDLDESQCTLTKTWHDFHQTSMRVVPMAMLVRRQAGPGMARIREVWG
jgi:uncharacterized protein (UPF0147 family)